LLFQGLPHPAFVVINELQGFLPVTAKDLIIIQRLRNRVMADNGKKEKEENKSSQMHSRLSLGRHCMSA
jgi:hypothetical protein